MSAQVLRIEDYDRPIREPREGGEPPSVIILPVIRIERHPAPAPRKKKR